MRTLFVAALIVAAVPVFGATVNVTVGPGLSFIPSSVTIAPGDTVSWNWTGSAHTSTSDNPIGPDAWNSGVLVNGSFTHTFNNAGNFPYYCALHSFPGGTFMNGVVRVAAAPTLTDVNPSSGSTAGGANVTLTGTNFASGCTVDFGGSAGTGTAVPNSTTITTTTPAHAAGAVTVTVTCPSGTASLTNGFTFTNAPSITSVNPTSALPGTTVTITGTGFQNGVMVSFRGVASPTVTFVNATTLQAVVPNISSGPATIVVTNPDTSSASFTGFVVVSLAVPLLSRELLLLMAAALGIIALLRL
jgi:plastocyanin